VFGATNRKYSPITIAPAREPRIIPRENDVSRGSFDPENPGKLGEKNNENDSRQQGKNLAPGIIAQVTETEEIND
jgi:hypothetical protein